MRCPVRGNVRVHAGSHSQNERDSITPPSDVDHFGEYDIGGLLDVTGRQDSDEEDDTARNTDQEESNLRLRQLLGKEHNNSGRERLVQDVHQVDLPLSRDIVVVPETRDRGCDLGTNDGGAGREETICDDGEPAHDERNARPSLLGRDHEREVVLASSRGVC